MEELKKNKKKGEIDIDLSVLLSDVWCGLKRFGLVLAAVLGILGALVNCYRAHSSYSPTYESVATFSVSTATSYGMNAEYYYSKSTATLMESTFPYILKSDILQQIVLNDLGISSLNANISAYAVKDTNLFTLRVTSTDPQRAYDVLVSLMENYPKIAEYVIGNTVLTVLSEPAVGTQPVNSVNYARSAFVGAFAGIFVAMAFVGLYALRRDTIRSSADLKEKLNQHYLGSVPKVYFKKHGKKTDTSVIIDNPKVSPTFVESVRVLKAHLLKDISKYNDRQIMVTSTIPNEGKTTVAVNLALSLVSSGHRVVIFDSDFRNPSVLKAIGCNVRSDTLWEKAVDPDTDIREALFKLKDTNLYIFSCVSKSSAAKIRHSDIAVIMKKLRDFADYTIVDTPPCGLFSDVVAMAAHVDSVVYVVKQNYARVDRIIDGINNVSAGDVRFAGFVLNESEGGAKSYDYSYGYKRYGKKHGDYGYGYKQD